MLQPLSRVLPWIRPHRMGKQGMLLRPVMRLTEIESTVGTESTEPQMISLDLTWDLSGIQFPMQVGSYSLRASLPEGYQLDANAAPLALAFSVTSNNASNEQVGLCAHHPQHTAECGYVAGVHACKFAEEGCP